MRKICCALALLLMISMGGCKPRGAEPTGWDSDAALRPTGETPETTAQTQAGTLPPSTAPSIAESTTRAKTNSADYKIPAAQEKDLLAKAQTALNREKKTLKGTEAVFTFAGDCTIGSFPECTPKKRFDTLFHADGSPTYPFDLVRGWFQADDRTIINFEGTLTTATKMANKDWRFKGEPGFAKILPESDVEIATLANNHSQDYLEAGYTDTLKYLTAENIAAGDEGRPVKFAAKGMEFVILSCNIWPITNVKQTDAEIAVLCEEISRYAQEKRAVIVCIHWGIEYAPANSAQKTYARQMIDAGAELIIGHHPHILQGMEQYKGKYICYSLGNFAFGGNAAAKPASLETILVRPRFEKISGRAVCTGLCVVPCHMTSHPDPKINNYRPMPVFGTQAQQVIDRVLRLSSALPDGIRQLDSFSTGI